MTPLGDPWYLVEKAMTRAISKKSSFKIIADWKETLSKTTQQRGKRKNVTLESFCETARFSTHCSYCIYWDNFSPILLLSILDYFSKRLPRKSLTYELIVLLSYVLSIEYCDSCCKYFTNVILLFSSYCECTRLTHSTLWFEIQLGTIHVHNSSTC